MRAAFTTNIFFFLCVLDNIGRTTAKLCPTPFVIIIIIYQVLFFLDHRLSLSLLFLYSFLLFFFSFRFFCVAVLFGY